MPSLAFLFDNNNINRRLVVAQPPKNPSQLAQHSYSGQFWIPRNAPSPCDRSEFPSESHAFYTFQPNAQRKTPLAETSCGVASDEPSRELTKQDERGELSKQGEVAMYRLESRRNRTRNQFCSRGQAQALLRGCRFCNCIWPIKHITNLRRLRSAILKASRTETKRKPCWNIEDRCRNSKNRTNSRVQAILTLWGRMLSESMLGLQVVFCRVIWLKHHLLRAHFDIQHEPSFSKVNKVLFKCIWTQRALEVYLSA